MPRPKSQQARLPSDAPVPHEGAPARRPAAPRKAAASRSVAAEPATGLVLRKSPARLKLELLEKEHERLLRDIQKKKHSCETTEHTVRDAHDAVHAQTTPLRATMIGLLREIHQIFDQLLAPKSGLSRSDRAALRRFHAHVIGDLPRPEASDDEPDERDAERSEGPDGASPPFDGDWAGPPHGAEHQSAHKPSEKNTTLLRALYRRLAVALHPDKASSAAEAERLTSLMKEVTRAYANEDLAKLVELDRTWLAQTPAGDPEDEFERRSASLFAANGELRRQLRGLTARLKQLKQTLPGVSWPRGGHASGAALAAGVIADIERELKSIERLRDAARDLKEGRIDVAEFLMGPRPPQEQSNDPLDDLFDQMLGDMLERAYQAERRGAGAARRGRGRR